MGTAVSTGIEVLRVTPYDRIFFMRKSGIFMVCDVPEKLFVDTGMWYCGYSEKESLSKVLFTIIYRDPKTQYAFIKRCRVEGYIMNRDYLIVPEGMEVLHVDTRNKFSFTLNFVQKPRLKITEQSFKAQDYEEKGLKTLGVRLVAREVESITVAEGSTKSTSEKKSVEKTSGETSETPNTTVATKKQPEKKVAEPKKVKKGTLPENENPRESVKIEKKK